MNMAVVTSVASFTMAVAAQATSTTVEASRATATSVGMEMSMGGSSGCKLSVSRTRSTISSTSYPARSIFLNTMTQLIFRH